MTRRDQVKEVFKDESSIGEEFGKLMVEYLQAVINEPVRPGSFRSLVGEDKDNRIYNFPTCFKKK